MASRRVKRGRRPPPSTGGDDAGASGAVQLALSKLLAYHRKVSEVSALLGISAGQVRALARRGLGPRQARNPEFVSSLLERLYRLLVAIDDVEERRRAAALLPARKLQRSEALREGRRLHAWSREFRRYGLRSLVRSDHGTVVKRGGLSETTPSPYPHIGQCLSWDNIQELRRWSQVKKVPDDRVGDVLAAVTSREYAVGAEARRELQELVSAARQGPGPGIEPYIIGVSGRRSDSVEKMGRFSAVQGPTLSDGRTGYRWGKPFNQFLSYKLIDSIYEFCRGVKLPREYRRTMRRWMCVAVCAEYYPKGVEPPLETKSDRKLKRDFEEDPELTDNAKRFTYNQGRSSGLFSSLADASKQLRNVLVERSELDLVTYVQGAVVFSWRPETAAERKRRIEAQGIARELSKSEKRMERERARTQLERSGLTKRQTQVVLKEFDQAFAEQDATRRELMGAPSAHTLRDRREYMRRIRRANKKNRRKKK